MNRQYTKFYDETDENRQGERILSLLIWVSWATYLVVIIASRLSAML